MCFETSYETNEVEDLRSIHAKLSSATFKESLLGFVQVLEGTRNTALRTAVQDHLRPIFVKSRTIRGLQGTQILVGECWFAFGQFLLHLFVPGTPIDPAGLKRCSDEYWDYQRRLFESQLEMHKSFAKRTDGNERNGTICYLENALSTMPAPSSDDSTAALPETRQDIVRLHTYWSEIHQLLSQVLSRQKLDAYIAVVHSRDAAAPMQEQVFQRSLSAFCKRLSAIYSDFEDINGPVQLALLSIRLGLRVMTHCSFAAPSADDSATLSHALSVFPTVNSANLLNPGVTNANTSDATLSTVLTRLSAISFQVQLGARVQDHLHAIKQLYEQAIGLWLIDQARLEESERAAQSLYRRKDDGNLNEAEEEEQEFLALFPEFEDVLESEQSKAQQPSSKTKAIVDSDAAAQLCTIHHELFVHNEDRITTAARRFTDFRRSLISTLAETELAFLPDSLDKTSIPFQARWLHDRSVTLNDMFRPANRPYDFYSDENIPEVRKAIEAIRALLQRLEAIIREWPDQMVLQHLKNRCQVVMGFSLHSPLAKILSAIEHLLANIDDWEMYANRDNSLKSHQQSLIALVVSWRRLELSSWQGLLDNQALAFESGASEWWFRLYEATIRGTLKTMDNYLEDDDSINTVLAEFLDSLIPLLDDFMSSSPLGQFATRLRLVNSMSVYAEKLAVHLGGHRGSVLLRVQRVLYNTAEYYAQYSGKVVKSLSEQRKSLEKGIQDFIKLASWKDVNIHALKQSAQKTHRHLYKIIRKFRELLRQPIAMLLEPSTSDGVDVVSASSKLPIQDLLSSNLEPIFPRVTQAVDQPTHLANLPTTYRNFDMLIRSRLVAHIGSHQADSVESLAGDIISVSKTLASIAIPADVDAARRTKLAKNLLNRKRKAWSDFLKELKRAGFSGNVKPEILERNHSKRHLREQHTLVGAARAFPSALKSEEYLHRVTGLLPQVRQALSDHHPDLSTRELQRALMHIEHNFFISLQCRAT